MPDKPLTQLELNAIADGLLASSRCRPAPDATVLSRLDTMTALMAALADEAITRRMPKGGTQILFGGQWLELCHTDLWDDIRCGGDGSIPPYTIAEAIKGTHGSGPIGARVTDRLFCVIIALSDG